MSRLAPALESFFTAHLMHALDASPHTVAAYRDTWKLLLDYMLAQTGTAPQDLEFAALDSAHVGLFLNHLEQVRGNSARTRNVRLAAVHSFCGYAVVRHPEHAETISRILAIPIKRTDRTDITYLDDDECRALLAAPDRGTRTGRRDQALLLTAIVTGLRSAELTGLIWADVHLGTGAHLNCHGKGRKDRATPLSIDARKVLQQWRNEIDPAPLDPVFPTSRGTRMSADAFAQRVSVNTKAAAAACPGLSAKNVTPHVLRHTTAMRMLRAGIDTSIIALWLGHENPASTQIYIHADLALKETALDRIRPTNTPTGRYKPRDKLLAFLEGL